MNKISSNLYKINFNNEIDKYINNSEKYVKNTIDRNKKRIYLNTYIIPIFFLIFSYYYSKYYYLNKKIISNNRYITKINNLNYLFTYQNPVIQKINKSYYKYFNSLNKNKNIDIDIDINDDLFKLKTKSFNELKNIKSFLFNSEEIQDINSKIGDLENNKKTLLKIIQNNVDKLDKLKINPNNQYYKTQFNKFIKIEPSNRNINNINNINTIFKIKNNIFNFIDIIINENYGQTKQFVNIIKNNLYKILKNILTPTSRS